jgi:hypothetical protein
MSLSICPLSAGRDRPARRPPHDRQDGITWHHASRRTWTGPRPWTAVMPRAGPSVPRSWLASTILETGPVTSPGGSAGRSRSGITEHWLAAARAAVVVMAVIGYPLVRAETERPGQPRPQQRKATTVKPSCTSRYVTRHGRAEPSAAPGNATDRRLFTIVIGDEFLIVAHTDHSDLGVARSASVFQARLQSSWSSVVSGSRVCQVGNSARKMPSPAPPAPALPPERSAIRRPQSTLKYLRQLASEPFT